jgi:hypothetical protein
VSRIEPSWHDANTFYVTYDNHRRDDFTPYVFVSTDGGRSFRSIAQGLPTGAADFVHVIREDPVNPDLLFVGTDLGAYVSTDRGATWRRFMSELPTVPVHDLRIHPRDRELIAATHGRSIWIVDIAPLQQVDRYTQTEPVLFQPKPGLQHSDPFAGWEFLAHKNFRGVSAPYGAEITYWVPRAAAQQDRAARAQVVVLGPRGDTMQTLTGPASAGLQRVYWNLRQRPARRDLSPSERLDSTENARVLQQVADSLVRAGGDRAVIEQVANAFRSGDFSALRGGNRGTPTTPERPGESYPTPGARQESAPPTAEVARQIQLAMRDRGRNFGGRGGGGADTPLADAGEYTVQVKIGDRTLTERLQVIRAPGFPTERPATQEGGR